MAAIGHDLQGRIGSAQKGLRVFQNFFIDIDMPRLLTVGDEISVPIAVYNYLDTPQLVTVELI